MRLETLAIHAGRAVDPSTGAVSLPLHTSTTFERAADGSFPTGFQYSREANPNRIAIENCIAALEGGRQAIAFASGMAAIAATIEAHATTDQARIIVPGDMYFGIRALVAETDFGRWFDFVTVDMTDLEQVRRVLAEAKTTLVWVETPSNPLITVVDIQAVSELAHSAGASVAVDNTCATPILQKPLSLGADIVVHSATKYIGGHSDVMLGLVVLSDTCDLGGRIRVIQKHKGGVPSPFDCWMALRGVQTLPLRMSAHCSNAATVVQALVALPGVEGVFYPGLSDDPGHVIAGRQMSGFGGMLSFVVSGGAEGALRFSGALKLITRATSLGGTHSLIEHRASIEGPGTRAPAGLLRLSVGLEHPDDIIEDLRAALTATFHG